MFMKWSEMKVAQLFPTLCDPVAYIVHGILQVRIFQAEVGNLSHLQEIFPTQGSNPGIEPRSPALQADSLPAGPQGKPKNTGWVACPFSSRSSWPRNQTEVSSIAGRFFKILYQLSYEGSLMFMKEHVKWLLMNSRGPTDKWYDTVTWKRFVK